MARKTITIIFVWSGKRVEVPADLYHAFKHVDAGKLLEARAPKASRARRRMGKMGKNENEVEKWTTITIPETLFKESKGLANLLGCTVEQFINEAIEWAIGEEKRKRGK